MEKQVGKMVVPANVKRMERFRNTIKNQIRMYLIFNSVKYNLLLVGAVNGKYEVLCGHINSVFRNVFTPKNLS